jgi:hypothetical protein
LLLINSLLPLAFSMVGLLFLAVEPEPTSIWRWCSAFATLFLVPYAVMIIKNLAGFAPGQLEAAGGTKYTSYFLFGLLIAVCLLQLINVAILTSFWPYFGAIVTPLMGAMYQFMRLVLIPQQPNT